MATDRHFVCGRCKTREYVFHLFDALHEMADGKRPTCPECGGPGQIELEFDLGLRQCRRGLRARPDYRVDRGRQVTLEVLPTSRVYRIARYQGRVSLDAVLACRHRRERQRHNAIRPVRCVYGSRFVSLHGQASARSWLRHIDQSISLMR